MASRVCLPEKKNSHPKTVAVIAAEGRSGCCCCGHSRALSSRAWLCVPGRSLTALRSRPQMRASQTAPWIVSLASLLIPQTAGFGGLSYLRTSSKTQTAGFGVNPALEGPSYYFLPKIGTDEKDHEAMQTPPPPAQPAPPPPPGGDECCIVYPRAICRGCIGYQCNDCCEFKTIWEVQNTMTPHLPPPSPPPPPPSPPPMPPPSPFLLLSPSLSLPL